MKKFLIFVDVKAGTQSNKYYNMEVVGNDCIVRYGRVGGAESSMTYPADRFNSLFKSKLRKGYTDVTNLKEQATVLKTKTDNKEFDFFFDTFSKYTRDLVHKTYIVDSCTPRQKEIAQEYLNDLVTVKNVDDGNDLLLSIYKTLPRKMKDVREHLLTDLEDLKHFVGKEQNLLDSMDSSNLIQGYDVLGGLTINFTEITSQEVIKFIQSSNDSRYKIFKTYKIDHPRQKVFDTWLEKQDDKHTELLIHGTRNPNIFSILKQGLQIRPSNAVTYSGSAYGDGCYHSSHTKKSLGFTGSDADKLLLLQKVHMGRFYTYDGWYYEGKSLERSKMNYRDLKSMGYDSLFVKPGSGLLNSEYIVYREEQTVTNYLVWMKY